MVNENEREDSEMCNTKILNYVLVNCVPSIYIPRSIFFADGYTAYYRCNGTQEASLTVKDNKLSMVVGLSKFNRQLDTYRFKEKGIEVVMQRAASDDNSEAIMSFIMPDVNNMTLLVKNNGYIIVKTTCWLTKTDKQ
ncbi:hypothetical protein [Klebsiella pneumoniae]|uniref:hypothetical protein n=1 Tax=Klebsiella pneumoniae TaxID=573 RepID=UPI0022B710B9|nr:hypothetical protein [Klebsiella pneumoniae]